MNTACCCILAFLQLFSIISLAFATDCSKSCFIQPPYNNITIVELESLQPAELNSLIANLSKLCEIRSFSNDDDVKPGRVNYLMLNKKQLYALYKLRHQYHYKVLCEDLDEFLKACPSQSSRYLYGKLKNSKGPSSMRGIPRRERDLPDCEIDKDFYESYHVYEALVKKWKKLAATFHGSLRLEVIGHTIEGRPIHMFRIGQTDTTRPIRILLNGMQHAREWISTMAPLYITERMALDAACGKNFLISFLLKKVEVLIVPMVNPDGYVYTHTNDRFWRKNRRNAIDCSRCAGVDLNRNWPVDFAGGKAASSDPCTDLYHGTAPFSEPETAALERVVQSEGGIEAYFDIHSYGQLILGPWAYTKEVPPRAEEIKALGKTLEASFSSKGVKYSFGFGPDKKLYLASGTAQDYLFDQKAMAFTIELRPKIPDTKSSLRETLMGFALDEDQILPTCEEAYSGTLDLLYYAATKVTDGFPNKNI